MRKGVLFRLFTGPAVRKLLCLSVLVGLVLGIAGCNTIKGVGRDIEELGDKLDEIF